MTMQTVTIVLDETAFEIHSVMNQIDTLKSYNQPEMATGLNRVIERTYPEKDVSKAKGLREGDLEPYYTDPVTKWSTVDHWNPYVEDDTLQIEVKPLRLNHPRIYDSGKCSLITLEVDPIEITYLKEGTNACLKDPSIVFTFFTKDDEFITDHRATGLSLQLHGELLDLLQSKSFIKAKAMLTYSTEFLSKPAFNANQLDIDLEVSCHTPYSNETIFVLTSGEAK